jgi:hypothetical protein
MGGPQRGYMMKREVISLGQDLYAIKFKYYMVTERTMAMTLPLAFIQKRIQFAEETKELAGKRRADSQAIADAYPDAVKALKEISPNLYEFVIFRATEENNAERQ